MMYDVLDSYISAQLCEARCSKNFDIVIYSIRHRCKAVIRACVAAFPTSLSEMAVFFNRLRRISKIPS